MASINKNPLGTIDTLGVSSEKIVGSLDCRRVRTASITCRTTYNALAASAVRINLYFSPDGNNFDTVAYTYFDISLTAGATVQRTAIIDFPEHGFMEVRVKNQDAAVTATDVKVWSTIIKWGDIQ